MNVALNFLSLRNETQKRFLNKPQNIQSIFGRFLCCIRNNKRKRFCVLRTTKGLVALPLCNLKSFCKNKKWEGDNHFFYKNGKWEGDKHLFYKNRKWKGDNKKTVSGLTSICRILNITGFNGLIVEYRF